MKCNACGCSGCPACDPEMRATISMGAAQHVRWLAVRTESQLRTLAEPVQRAYRASTFGAWLPAATTAQQPPPQYADPPPSLRDALEAKRPSLRERLERRGGRLVVAATSVAAAAPGYADPPPSLADRLRSTPNRP